MSSVKGGREIGMDKLHPELSFSLLVLTLGGHTLVPCVSNGHCAYDECHLQRDHEDECKKKLTFGVPGTCLPQNLYGSNSRSSPTGNGKALQRFYAGVGFKRENGVAGKEAVYLDTTHLPKCSSMLQSRPRARRKASGQTLN
jgi:hypothetical protein